MDRLLKRNVTLVLLLTAVLLSHTGCGDCKNTWARWFGITVEEPDDNTPEKIVQQTLCAALDKDEERGFETIKKLTHSAVYRDTFFADLRRFVWKKFREFAPRYVLDAKKCSFRIKQWTEVEDMTGDIVKVYVEDQKGLKMPTPIWVKKEKDGKWKLYKMSP